MVDIWFLIFLISSSLVAILDFLSSNSFVYLETSASNSWMVLALVSIGSAMKDTITNKIEVPTNSFFVIFLNIS